MRLSKGKASIHYLNSAKFFVVRIDQEVVVALGKQKEAAALALRGDVSSSSTTRVTRLCQKASQAPQLHFLPASREDN
jgi:hypothetical protein